MPLALKMIVGLIALTLLALLIALPVIGIRIYRSTFDVSFRTSPEHALTASHFDGLTVETVRFPAKQGHMLAGYRYHHESTAAPKGMVVLAHGFGGGGHCSYMPLIAYFASHGYDVFSYDATACDNSEGEVIGSFPQGVMDLDSAISHVKATEPGMPIFLVGHSWGAYSVGNVLNFHPDVSGAVMFAGFDRTELMLMQEGEKRAGKAAGLLIPFAKAYENIRGGAYAHTSAVGGFRAAKDAQIMIVHSSDDKTVTQAIGYDLFETEFAGDDRFRFVHYEHRGHNNLWLDPQTKAYRNSLGYKWRRFLKETGMKDSPEARAAFRDNPDYVDFSLCYALDEALMGSIITMFDSTLQ